MVSSKFKPERERGSDLKPHRSIVAVPKSVTEAIAKRYAAGLNQHEQSLVYREHCAALRKARPKRKAKAQTAPQHWSPPLSNRERKRRQQLARITARKKECANG